MEVNAEHRSGSQSSCGRIWRLGLHRAHVLRSASCEQGAHDSSMPTLASLVPSLRAVSGALIRLNGDTYRVFCDFPTTGSFEQLTKSPEVVSITLLSCLWGEKSDKWDAWIRSRIGALRTHKHPGKRLGVEGSQPPAHRGAHCSPPSPASHSHPVSSRQQPCLEKVPEP